MSQKPRILVTLDTGESKRRGVGFPAVHLKAAYGNAVEKADGIPLLVGPSDRTDVVEALIELADGLVVTGGAFDIHPRDYGQKIEARFDEAKPARTAFEAALLRRALAQHLPVLGVCGGMQLMNVVCGGTLIQDIAQGLPAALDHEQPHSPEEPSHPVVLEPQSLWAKTFSTTRLEVNSTHHQAVDRLGDAVTAWGHAPDGVIEAIAVADHPFAVGVQWHPELLDDAVSHRLYERLVAAARKP